ncbi:hypothetical protein CBM2586_B130486 [Cupriavidus phytorum]|uniref:Uncharacterized protein n=3 Tax=Cupriavidus TaxID=106589 RepID=A0A975XIE3_9BURK|nr:hypothetical protein [Cupriavidus taiwanensis]PZX34298.1 hypothetical protein C7416_101582 [Cupriavidus alkaliphilus]SOY71766.1 hypothetical protein CBM2586_B130486 [Cupriavidus taiwanensis]
MSKSKNVLRSQLDLRKPDAATPAIPGQLLTKLPALPASPLDMAEKLYQASLPKPSHDIDGELSPYERISERVYCHFVASPVEAEILHAIYAWVRIVTATMERDFIDWCHRLAEISMRSELIQGRPGIRFSMLICAPLYMQAEKGLFALLRFMNSPIPHRSWTDFDTTGAILKERPIYYVQLPIVPVRMSKGVEHNDILFAVLDAYDLAGNFDEKRRIKAETGHGQCDITEVIKVLLRSSVAVVAFFGWRESHHHGKSLWKILSAFREAGIGVVLYATAAIGLCRQELIGVFPQDPVEIGAYNLCRVADLARAYAETMSLCVAPDRPAPAAWINIVGGLYGYRELLDAAAQLVVHRIHIENEEMSVALTNVKRTILEEFSGSLAAINHLHQYGTLPTSLVSQNRDRLPLALVQRFGGDRGSKI